MSDDEERPKREWDDFSDLDEPENNEGPTAAETVAVAAVPALKGMLSDMTIIPVKATEEEKNIGYENPSLLPLVGIVVGLFLMLVLKLVEMVEDSLGVMMGPFFAILAIAFPLILFRFEFLGSLLRFGGRLFPEASEGTNAPVAGIGLSIIAIGGSMILYVIAAGFVGTFFMGLVVAFAEIYTLNTLASTRAFAKDMSLSGVTVSSVVSMIGAAVLAVIWMLINGDFVAGLLIAVVVLAVVSVFIGYFIAKISKKRFGDVTEDAMGASVELSRMFLVGIGIVAIMLF